MNNLPTIDQDADTATSDVEPSTESTTEVVAEPLVEEPLVEEVSIDGMCGVY